MERIALITMPVMDVNRPSISLTQLQSVVQRRLGDRVAVEILYLNHDFARWIAAGARVGGADLYRLLLDNQHTGLPDWFFRQVAFPELPDNAAAYFKRYYPGRSPAVQAIKDALLERRRGLAAFLDGLIERYAIGGAGIVGFTSMFAQNVASFALARRLKDRRPEQTIVIGGANCETPMGEELVKHVAAVDYVFSGPALLGFPEFVAHWLDDAPDRCAAIPGVFSKAVPERARGEQIGAELDIDADVALDYDAFFRSFERHFPTPDEPPMVLVETSRGCWWGERSHCTFCGLNGQTMAYRAMAPERALALMHSLFERYRPKASYFFCVDNIMPRNYVDEVLPRLQAPPGTRIFYEVKADLKDDALRVLAASGVTKIQPGIESLASSTLALMRKGTTAFVNLRLLKGCIAHGITPAWNLLIGFPGEGDDVYAKYASDLPRLFHLCPPEGVAPIRFDRYSPYFMRADEYGLTLRRFDFYPLIYPFDEASLARMAYYFVDVNYDAPYIKSAAQWIGALRERIAEWRGRWNADGEASRPRLALERRGTGTVVVDTRARSETVHDVSDARLGLLEYLERPRKQRELQELAAERGFDLDAELAYLDERRLVWHEGERWMSVVTGVGR